MVAKEKQKPPNEPRLWRNGLGPLGGWQPVAGQDDGSHNRGSLGVEGVTMAPAPPTRREPGRAEDDSQQETGDSVRPSSQLVGGQAAAGMPADALFLKRRCKSARQQSKQGTPPRKPEKTPKNKPPEPRTEKQPLGRRTTPNGHSRVSEKQKTGKRKKNREKRQTTRKNARDRGALKAERLKMYGSKGVSLSKNH